MGIPDLASLVYGKHNAITAEVLTRYTTEADHYQLQLDNQFSNTVAFSLGRTCDLSDCDADFITGYDAAVPTSIFKEPRLGFLDYLAVSPDVRNQGYGRYLLAEMLATFQQNGCDAAIAMITADRNEPLGEENFLTRHGFRHILSAEEGIGLYLQELAAFMHTEHQRIYYKNLTQLKPIQGVSIIIT